MEDCRDACNIMEECEYFNYDARKTNCFLFKVSFTTKSKFSSGKKNCQTEGRMIIVCHVLWVVVPSTC